MFYIPDDISIEVQLRPDLVQYYRKYCSYEVDTISDMAYGIELREPPERFKNFKGETAEVMSLVEWCKRKMLTSCLGWQNDYKGKRIGPAVGYEGDVVCVILALVTLKKVDDARRVKDTYTKELVEINALSDMDFLLRKK